jgi:protein transport protein SEC24
MSRLYWRRRDGYNVIVQVRPPQPPIYIFIIDVSYSAINSGMVATAARTLLESLDRLPNEDSRTKISIIAVDSCLHFFSLAVSSPFLPYNTSSD